MQECFYFVNFTFLLFVLIFEFFYLLLFLLFAL